MSKHDIIKLVLILAVLAAAVVLILSIDTRREAEETEVVRRAVREAAVTCYAVEGAYPEELDYLREHYRLAYDRERYVVFYDWVAGNLIPDIVVRERGVALP